MRKGAEFISRKGVRSLNLNYIIKRLEACADKYNDCRHCPDLIPCTKAYDERCSVTIIGETGITKEAKRKEVAK